MARVDPDLGADGRAGGDRAPAVHGVEPAATLDGEQEEGTHIEGLLQADAAAAHTGDLEIAFELVGTGAVRGIPPLGALLAAAIGAGEFECQVADLTAALLLAPECGGVGLPGPRPHLGLGIRGPT